MTADPNRRRVLRWWKRRKQRKAMTKLTRMSQEMGLYDRRPEQ